ncbi:MAG: polysaccharide biosynthesis tyrosine autokinase [Candidatus Saccharibacteria bacterium]|nr:polysaccharide biosynthesis tyrosine autokinase [Candidatus Saccharibacteria bacterium]
MEDTNIKEFLTYLKKYIPAIILIAGLATFGTFLYEKKVKTPIYQSTAKVVLVQQNENNATTSSAALNDYNVNQKLAGTYTEIAKSELVLGQVITDLNLDTSVKELSKNLTVSTVEGTTILTISVKNKSAEEATKIANKIAEVFTKEITAIYKLDNVSLLDEAKTNNNPVNNTTIRDIIIAGFLAVFGVTALAFLIFCLDDTVKHGQNLETTLGVPVAGKIIDGSTKKRKKNNVKKLISDELVVEDQPKSVVSESIKNLRTNLQFTSVDQDLKTILLTSSNASEGKSYVASNLAVSFAQADKRVLIVDCDLRKGRLHKIFGAVNTYGLSNLLADDLNNAYRYIQKTNIKGLDILPRGTYPPNPSELLGSKKNAELVNRLKSQYDIVIFDGTPSNGLADSIVMSTLVDQVLIIAHDSVTKSSALAETKASLDKVNAKIAGVVLNRISRKGNNRYYYYYYGDKKHDRSA